MGVLPGCGGEEAHRQRTERLTLPAPQPGSKSDQKGSGSVLCAAALLEQHASMRSQNACR